MSDEVADTALADATAVAVAVVLPTFTVADAGDKEPLPQPPAYPPPQPQADEPSTPIVVVKDKTPLIQIEGASHESATKDSVSSTTASTSSADSSPPLEPASPTRTLTLAAERKPGLLLLGCCPLIKKKNGLISLAFPCAVTPEMDPLTPTASATSLSSPTTPKPATSIASCMFFFSSSFHFIFSFVQLCFFSFLFFFSVAFSTFFLFQVFPFYFLSFYLWFCRLIGGDVVFILFNFFFFQCQRKQLFHQCADGHPAASRIDRRRWDKT